jgi:hypothetical protein
MQDDFDPDIEELLKKLDWCARKAKATYKVWPSAYASGAAAKCRKCKMWSKEKAKKSEDPDLEQMLLKTEELLSALDIEPLDKAVRKTAAGQRLKDWFKQDWRSTEKHKSGPNEGEYKPCGRSDADSGEKAKCRPTKSVGDTPSKMPDSAGERAALKREKNKVEKQPTETQEGGSAKPKRTKPMNKAEIEYMALQLLFKSDLSEPIAPRLEEFDIGENVAHVRDGVPQYFLPHPTEPKAYTYRPLGEGEVAPRKYDYDKYHAASKEYEKQYAEMDRTNPQVTRSMTGGKITNAQVRKYKQGDKYVVRSNKVIPSIDSPDRPEYDRKFIKTFVKMHIGDSPERVQNAMSNADFYIGEIPADRQHVSHKNPMVYRASFEAYQVMLALGEPLHPAYAFHHSKGDGDDHYHIEDGNHRVYAAQSVGAPTVPAIIRTSKGSKPPKIEGLQPFDPMEYA